MHTVTRKTISLPVALADRIKREANNERRAFSSQVVKVLEDIFLPSTVRQSKPKARK